MFIMYVFKVTNLIHYDIKEFRAQKQVYSLAHMLFYAITTLLPAEREKYFLEAWVQVQT